MYLGVLVNLGWIVWYVLAETLIQMMHLRRAHTVFLMVWNILWSEGLGGHLSAWYKEEGGYYDHKECHIVLLAWWP